MFLGLLCVDYVYFFCHLSKFFDEIFFGGGGGGGYPSIQNPPPPYLVVSELAVELTLEIFFFWDPPPEVAPELTPEKLNEIWDPLPPTRNLK